MSARTKSYVTPKFKTKYKVWNWPAYEAALRKRGDVTIWFDEAAADAWNAPASGLPGGPRRSSDLAIGRFTADGSYDTREVYEALAGAAGEARVGIVIPPRKTATHSQPPEDLVEQRDAAIGRIAEVGRLRWRKESEAHRQDRGEDTWGADNGSADRCPRPEPDVRARNARFGGDRVLTAR